MDYFITTMFNRNRKTEQRTKQEWELWKEAWTVFEQLSDWDQNFIRSYQYHETVW